MSADLLAGASQPRFERALAVLDWQDGRSERSAAEVVGDRDRVQDRVLVQHALLEPARRLDEGGR